MTGEKLKSLLNIKGLTQSKIAEMLGIPQQTLQKKFSSDSIKTSLLEELCDKLNLDLYFFYGGTKYLPAAKVSNNSEVVPKYLYDELRRELYDYHDQIRDLLQKIALLESDRKPSGTDHQKNAV